MMWNVVVTARSFGSASDKAEEILRNGDCNLVRHPGPLAPEALIAALKDADGLIVGTDTVNEQVITTAPRLKVISKHGAGVDNIDIAAATRLGVAVASVPDANVEAVADLAFGLMLAAARHIPAADYSTRRGKWERFSGVQVYGKNLGIIGFGRIGRAVARRGKGFGMAVAAYDPYPDRAAAASLDANLMQLDSILSWADFVSLHLPLTPRTRGLIGKAELQKMKRSGILINTARGGVVDEEALAWAVKEGIIRGAGVDVFSEEPPGEDHPFFAIPGIVATPHLAAHTAEAIDLMSIGAAENAVAILNGRPCRFLLNPEALSR